nr:zinc finger, CCHC-type [Tanacetum cinerariifolium]
MSNHSTLGEDFFKACITEAYFLSIAEKKQNIPEKEDTTLSLPSEEVSPMVEGSLNASKDTILSSALNVASLEVVFAGPDDEESTSGKTIVDESVGIEQNEPIDVNEGKSLNLVVAANDVGNNGFSKIDNQWQCNLFTTGGVAQIDTWNHNRSQPVNTFEWGSGLVHCNLREPNILAAYGNDMGITDYVLRVKYEAIKKLKERTQLFKKRLKIINPGIKIVSRQHLEGKGAQGGREAEVFQVSNDDTVVAQRRLEDKQPKEKTNTDCLVVLYRNMGFNESGEYKKTFIGFGVGMGSIQVLHEFEFEVKPLGDHTFELARDREQHLACELFGYREHINEAAFVVVVVEKIYAHESPTFNNTVASTVAGNAMTIAMAINESIHQYGGRQESEWLYSEGVTVQVLQQKLVQTLLEGHSILLLEGSLSGDCDMEKNGKWSCTYSFGSQEYQMVYTRPDIASTDVGMLDGFDRGLRHTYRFLWILATPWVDQSQESRCELKLVAGIATGALVKGGSRFEVPAQVEVAAYRKPYDEIDFVVVVVYCSESESTEHMKQVAKLAIQRPGNIIFTILLKLKRSNTNFWRLFGFGHLRWMPGSGDELANFSNLQTSSSSPFPQNWTT